ncbi:MAG TPA: hypothetical protein VHK69_12625, partial [Chitinophagaceae bacterium]|nr:hypothetical protein [Chitinophagaceae bacterium]
ESVALPAADKRDGVEEEYAEGTKAWRALSGKEVVERFDYKLRKATLYVERFHHAEQPVPPALQKEIQSVKEKLSRLQGTAGFTVSTPELWLSKSNLRAIILDIGFGEPFLSAEGTSSMNLLPLFTVTLSTEKGPVPLKVHPLVLPDASEESIKKLAFDVFPQHREDAGECVHDPMYAANNRVAKVSGAQTYVIVLDLNFPAVMPLANGAPPFLRFSSLGGLAGAFPILSFGLRTFSLATFPGHRLLPSDIPLTLHRLNGTTAEAGTQLVIGPDDGQEIFIRNPELFYKDVRTLTVNLPGRLDPQQYAFLKELTWQKPDASGTVGGAYREVSRHLLPPADFRHDNLAENANGWIRLTFDGPAEPFVLQANAVSFRYETNPVTIPVSEEGSRIPSLHTAGYFSSQGEWLLSAADASGLRPTPLLAQPVRAAVITPELLEEQPPAPAANGNLFLGLEHLEPGQNLSLLFKTVPGTGNPDHFAPEVVWSYLKDNEWMAFPPQYLLKDETLGLKQTGILLLQIPADINNGNTWIKGKEDRTDLYWIRASATELPADSVFVDALPMLQDVFVNAATAVFEDARNTTGHLVSGIPGGTISALRFRDVQVKSVQQPYPSFGGRLPETGDRHRYYCRVSERLRHKHRAVTVWDYEHIVLQDFPRVMVAKCLPHTRRYAVVRPGNVTMAVIPDPAAMTGTRTFFPAFEAGDLQAIHDQLIRQNSYFVGGHGDPDFCCCPDDDCACEKESSRLSVINARFEPVRLKVCVRFYPGRDVAFYRRELNEALKHFLAPWARSGTQLQFGVAIRLTTLLQFLEGLEYVDVVLNLQVKHFAARQTAEEEEENIPWGQPEEIKPFTAASVLTTYLDRLNEDNPNVIDHEIRVARGDGRCTCGSCEEKEAAVAGGADLLEELRTRLLELWSAHGNKRKIDLAVAKALDQAVDAGTLSGEKPALPEAGEEGRHAYRIRKVMAGTRVLQLTISLSTAEGEPFRSLTIDNPHLHQ